ncbi:MAG: response regulator [Planctomycetaceae bacterium]|jgi:CheY-like chemotaxis protein|nr:response regulator [Planctomycetaceae bacterium]
MNGQPLTILHVEDNTDHAQLIARSLQKNRVANVIRHVLDGEEALDYLFLRGEYATLEVAPRPQIILLDLRLPKVDGLEVLRTIKTTDALLPIPVVILTSSEAEKDVARAYEYHANSYLVKPVGFDKFSEMMEQLGFYWLAWNRYPWSLDVAEPAPSRQY